MKGSEKYIPNKKKYIRVKKNQQLAILNITKQKQKFAEELTKREKLLLVGAEATKAIRCKSNFKKTVEEILGLLGRTAEVKTVIIFKYTKVSDTKKDTLKIQYGWCSQKVNLYERNKVLANLLLDEILPLDFQVTLMARKPYIIGEDQISSRIVEVFQLDSGFTMLVLPIFFNEKLWGLIALYDVDHQRDWTESEKSVLETVATSIGSSLEVRKQNMMLTKYNRVKTEFLTNVSHELRTPLAGISAFTQILLQDFGSLNKTQQECLLEIEINVMKMRIEINILLELTRIESGEVLISPEKITVAQEINYIINQLKPILDQKEIGVEIKIENMLDVYLDPRLFQQILINLINNAVVYMPKKGKVSILAEQNRKRFICIITDSGPGIDPTDKKKLFEKYYHAPQREASSIGGTGLGLYLSRRLVELQGGEMWADEGQNGGSKFGFAIPNLFS